MLTTYDRGDRVAYDDAQGTVVGPAPALRPEGVDYWVRWDDTGRITKVWGSDLVGAP